MSSNLVGAEQGQMDALSQAFNAYSAEIAEIVGRLPGQVQSTTEWKGAARDRFDAQWPEYVKNLQQFQELLQQSSVDIKMRGDAIIAAGSH